MDIKYLRSLRNNSQIYEIDGGVLQATDEETFFGKLWRYIVKWFCGRNDNTQVMPAKRLLADALGKAEGNDRANEAMRRVFGKDWEQDGTTRVTGRTIHQVLDSASHMRMDCIVKNRRTAEKLFHYHVKSTRQVRDIGLEDYPHLKDRFMQLVIRHPDFYKDVIAEEDIKSLASQAIESYKEDVNKTFALRHPGLSEIADMFKIKGIRDEKSILDEINKVIIAHEEDFGKTFTRCARTTLSLAGDVRRLTDPPLSNSYDAWLRTANGILDSEDIKSTGALMGGLMGLRDCANGEAASDIRSIKIALLNGLIHELKHIQSHEEIRSFMQYHAFDADPGSLKEVRYTQCIHAQCGLQALLNARAAINSLEMPACSQVSLQVIPTGSEIAPKHSQTGSLAMPESGSDVIPRHSQTGSLAMPESGSDVIPRHSQTDSLAMPESGSDVIPRHSQTDSLAIDQVNVTKSPAMKPIVLRDQSLSGEQTKAGSQVVRKGLTDVIDELIKEQRLSVKRNKERYEAARPRDEANAELIRKVKGGLKSECDRINQLSERIRQNKGVALEHSKTLSITPEAMECAQIEVNKTIRAWSTLKRTIVHDGVIAESTINPARNLRPDNEAEKSLAYVAWQLDQAELKGINAWTDLQDFPDAVNIPRDMQHSTLAIDGKTRVDMLCHGLIENEAQAKAIISTAMWADPKLREQILEHLTKPDSKPLKYSLCNVNLMSLLPLESLTEYSDQVKRHAMQEQHQRAQLNHFRILKELGEQQEPVEIPFIDSEGNERTVRVKLSIPVIGMPVAAVTPRAADDETISQVREERDRYTRDLWKYLEETNRTGLERLMGDLGDPEKGLKGSARGTTVGGMIGKILDGMDKKMERLLLQQDQLQEEEQRQQQAQQELRKLQKETDQLRYVERFQQRALRKQQSQEAPQNLLQTQEERALRKQQSREALQNLLQTQEELAQKHRELSQTQKELAKIASSSGELLPVSSTISRLRELRHNIQEAVDIIRDLYCSGRYKTSDAGRCQFILAVMYANTLAKQLCAELNRFDGKTGSVGFGLSGGNLDHAGHFNAMVKSLAMSTDSAFKLLRVNPDSRARLNRHELASMIEPLSPEDGANLLTVGLLYTGDLTPQQVRDLLTNSKDHDQLMAAIRRQNPETYALLKALPETTDT